MASGNQRSRLGKKGEKLAEKYLLKKGMRLTGRNLRRKIGEIDLLMEDGEELVIVEVRTISEQGEIALEERVPHAKRRQLMRLARKLITELDDPLPPIRFDLCVVVINPETTVHHFEDAFRVDRIGPYH